MLYVSGSQGSTATLSSQIPRSRRLRAFIMDRIEQVFDKLEVITVELDDKTLIKIALAAHEADMKLNDFIVELITRCVTVDEKIENG